ncbi:MAG TPA: WD40 repeat domain-containing protein, partial [Actinomycetota bacterium]|nr:WD40 repeat domain-containing protein [Actinomycetota bacterium]
SGFAGRVAWAPDGLRIATATGYGTAQVWHGKTGKPLFTLFGHRAPLYAIDWSPDGSRLVTGGDDGTAKVWDMTQEGGRELFSLSSQATAAGIYAAVFSPDGIQVMTGDFAVTNTSIWDVGIGGNAEWMNVPAQISNPVLAGGVEFLPDGHHLASTDEGNSIALWDLATGRKLRTFRVSGGPITSFNVTDDGTGIAASQTGFLTAWDVGTGEEVFRFDCECATLVDVDWSPDGEHLLAAGDFGAVGILDTTGSLVRTLDEEGNVYLTSARFSPDGRFVVTALQRDGSGAPHYRQTIWEWERGTVVGAIQPIDNRNTARVAVFDPSGSRVATSGNDGVPRIWDIDTGRILVALAGHSSAPWDVAFSPDGSRIATAGSEGVVRLFDPASGEQVLALYGHEQRVVRLAFSPDGTMLASASMDGTVRIWALDLDDLLEIARQQVTRALSDEECRQYLHLETCAASG